MSDRARLLMRNALHKALLGALLGALLSALLGAPSLSSAQSLDELRARRNAAERALALTVERQTRLHEFGRFDGEGEIRSAGRVVRYRVEEITSSDSAHIAEGLELGRTRLAERFGDAGTALIDTATWVVTRNRGKTFSPAVLFAQREPSGARASLSRPISASSVADYVLSQAGDRLVGTTPAFRGYAGWTAFLADRVQSEEIARGLATSWAVSGRRCATRAVAACKAVLAPFDSAAGFARYFDASDTRAVVTSARLPGLPDSAFSVGRRECLKGSDSACARIIDRIVPADPFNSFTRGSLLAHAIALGGNDALTRLAAAPDGPPIAVLASIAGISEEALIDSWYAQTFAAVTRGPAAMITPLLTTAAWCVLLMLVALRRRFL